MSLENVLKQFESAMIVRASEDIRIDYCAKNDQPFQAFKSRLVGLDIHGAEALRAIAKTPLGKSEHPNDILASLVAHNEIVNKVDGTPTSMLLRDVLSKQESYCNVAAYAALAHCRDLLAATYETPRLLPYLDGIKSSNLKAEHLMMMKTARHLDICASYCEDSRTREKEREYTSALFEELDLIKPIMNNLGFNLNMPHGNEWQMKVEDEHQRVPSRLMRSATLLETISESLQESQRNFRAISESRGIKLRHYPTGGERFFVEAKKAFLQIGDQDVSGVKKSILNARTHAVESVKYDYETPGVIRAYQVSMIKDKAQEFLRIADEMSVSLMSKPEDLKKKSGMGVNFAALGLPNIDI